jgi:hypothetical protein
MGSQVSFRPNRGCNRNWHLAIEKKGFDVVNLDASVWARVSALYRKLKFGTAFAGGFPSHATSEISNIHVQVRAQGLDVRR